MDTPERLTIDALADAGRSSDFDAKMKKLDDLSGRLAAGDDAAFDELQRLARAWKEEAEGFTGADALMWRSDCAGIVERILALHDAPAAREHLLATQQRRAEMVERAAKGDLAAASDLGLLTLVAGEHTDESGRRLTGSLVLVMLEEDTLGFAVGTPETSGEFVPWCTLRQTSYADLKGWLQKEVRIGSFDGMERRVIVAPGTSRDTCRRAVRLIESLRQKAAGGTCGSCNCGKGHGCG